MFFLQQTRDPMYNFDPELLEIAVWPVGAVFANKIEACSKNDYTGAYFRALELGCRTGVPSQIGTPVPTSTFDLEGLQRALAVSPHIVR